jgi:hypothetical protein
MLDFAGPGLKKMMNKKMAGMLQNAPFKFAPENGLAYFEDLGWHTAEVESLFVAARRFHRLPLVMRPVAWLPQPDQRHPGSMAWSAAALLTPLAAVELLPDAYPVDEHVRGIGPRSGIAATGTGNRKIEDRKHRVAGVVERPIRQRVRRHIEVWLRTVNVVLPEADPGLIPLASPRVPPAVHRDVVGLPRGAV